MERYAIIKIGPSQYKIEEGKTYEVPKFVAEEGKAFTGFELLALANGEKIEFGKPSLDGKKVSLKVLEQTKGEKVTKNIYKAKSRYRRKVGHRKLVTKFLVEKISA